MVKRPLLDPGNSTSVQAPFSMCRDTEEIH